MGLYAGIDGTRVKISKMLSGIDGSKSEIQSLKVGISGTIYTISLSSDAKISIRFVNNAGSLGSAIGIIVFSVNDKDYSMFTQQPNSGESEISETIPIGTAFQINSKISVESKNEFYLNGDLFYSGGSKDDASPKIITIQANGSLSIVAEIANNSGGGQDQITQITGDAVLISVPES